MKSFSFVLLVSLTCAAFSKSLPFNRDVVLDAVDTFAFDVYKQVDFFHDNIVFADLGMAMVLGLILKGAKGQTASEIEKVLYLSGTSKNTLHANLSKLLNTEVERPRNDVTLNVSNLVLASKDIPVKPEYLEFIRNNYRALFQSVDYANDDGAIVREVNQFVSNQTKGVIPTLLREPLNKTSQLTVINTVYFQGLWKTPFPKANTHRAPFYNMNGTVSQVDMMHVVTDVEKCRMESLNASLIHIHFKESVVMNLVQPDTPFGDDDVLVRLNSTYVLQCALNQVKARVNLYLPRFRLDYFWNLNELFSKLGAPSMFNPRKADLTGITDFKPFALTNAITRNILNFNEDGANAENQAESFNKTFSSEHDSNIETIRVDHPFGFSIYDDIHKFAIFGDIVNNL